MPRLPSPALANAKAALAVFVTAFLGAFCGYLETQLEAGIPPQNQWKHVLAAGAVVGLLAAYHRWKPTPAAVSTGTNIVLLLACGCALASSACGPSTPTPQQQAQLVTYGAALQACILDAKAGDGGLARYQVCAHGVDVTFGVVDAGGSQ